MSKMVQINHPVPLELAEKWKRTCKKYKMGYGEGLAAALFASELFPRDAQIIFKGLALGEYPPVAQQAVEPVIAEIQAAIADIFREPPKPEGSPSAPDSGPGPRPKKKK